MANDKAPRAAAGGGATYVIVGISIVLILALMAWLHVQSGTERIATVAGADSAAAESEVAGPPPSQVVNSTQFEASQKTYVDQVVELTDARYQAGLSPQTFWIELPTGAPFLVKLDSAMVAAGKAVPTNGTLDIIGTVKQKDNALVAQWLAAGVLTNDDQRLQAEFGTTYLDARQIRPATAQ